MRESTLQQLHEGHLGFTKCYHRAKQTVYWPNLRKELEDLVLNCQLCLKHSQAKRKEFKQVMLDMSVNHITSSPHYPQSNGLAEKYVQIVKNLFVKAHEEGTDYQKALMIYRNTPLDDNLTLPMQILQGRTARSDLPMSYAAKVKIWTCQWSTILIET